MKEWWDVIKYIYMYVIHFMMMFYFESVTPSLSICSSQPLVLSWLHVGLQSLVPQHEHPAQEHVSHESAGDAHEEESQEEGL